MNATCRPGGPRRWRAASAWASAGSSSESRWPSPAPSPNVPFAVDDFGGTRLAAFVEAAGLACEDVDAAQAPATAILAGELLRLSIGGLYRMLERRGQTRHDLHVGDRTAIATR